MMRTRKGYTLAPTHCKFAVRDAARDCTLHVVSTPAAIAAKAEQDVARVSQTYESTAVEPVHLLARLRVRGSELARREGRRRVVEVGLGEHLRRREPGGQGEEGMSQVKAEDRWGGEHIWTA